MSRLHRFVDRILDLTLLPGLLSTGYALRSRAWEGVPLEPESLRGRTVIVTGATSGLGFEAAWTASAAGAVVYMVDRDPAQLADARAKIAEHVATARIYTEVCDFSRMESVLALADGFLASRGSADILINSAAALPDSYIRTEDGFEFSFASNVLAPFLLTNLLIPALTDTPDPRVINVVSAGVYLTRLHVDDLELTRRTYDPRRSYLHSKRILLELTSLWNDRLGPDGITAHAVHPGWTNSTNGPTVWPAVRRAVRPLLRSPEQGADTAAWLATCPDAVDDPGQLWHDRRVRPQHRLPWTRPNEWQREHLWEELTQMASSWHRARPLSGGDPLNQVGE